MSHTALPEERLEALNNNGGVERSVEGCWFDLERVSLLSLIHTYWLLYIVGASPSSYLNTR